MIAQLEADAATYDVSMQTVAEWAVERAEQIERQARGTLTRRLNAQATDRCESDRSTSRFRIKRGLEDLAAAAHVLADAQAALDSIIDNA